MISVDTKKKELAASSLTQAARQWWPKGQPVAAHAHDIQDGAGKAVPDGVYDLTGNAGWVSVGTDHDTAAFAVESIRRWWKAAGQAQYPLADGC